MVLLCAVFVASFGFMSVLGSFNRLFWLDFTMPDRLRFIFCARSSTPQSLKKLRCGAETFGAAPVALLVGEREGEVDV